MKKIKQFILTKDFLIKIMAFIIVSLFGTLLSFILFFSKEDLKLTKEMHDKLFKHDTQIALNVENIIDNEEDTKENKKGIEDNKKEINFLKNITFKVRK